MNLSSARGGQKTGMMWLVLWGLLARYNISEYSVQKKLARIQSIEEEYGEPLRDIIVGFREQRCSWETIESVLEISHSSLLKWRQDIGLECDGRINYERRESKSNRVAQTMGYRDFETMYREMRQSGMTLKQISKKTGLAESTISGNAPEKMKYRWVVTPKMKRARLKNLTIGREKQIENRRLINELYENHSH